MIVSRRVCRHTTSTSKKSAGTAITPTTTNSYPPLSMNSLTKNSPEAFGEEYYRTGNYADYLERGPRYHQIAIELDQLFRTLNLFDGDGPILDYGCGVGFLSEALTNRGY